MENNNLNELEQLKAQYETLKEQFDQQEIVNERLMKSSIKHSVDFYKRYRWMQFIAYPLLAVVGLLIIKWLFANNLSLRLFWVSFCVICFIVEFWMTKMVRFKSLENNDLLTLSSHARSFKKLYAIFVVSYAVSIIILFVGWLMTEIGSNGYFNFGTFIILSGLVLVLTMSLGIAEIRYKTRPCDEIIRQIEASDNDINNRKTGFDRKQKWFCVAMIVAFIGLDVWAYTIVGSRLKMPPMWQTREYVRAADDLTTEGKLEFWEVFTDTVVPEGNVPMLMKQWQQNDSLVVMVANERQEEKPQAKVYMLKKTTPEGPVISSSILGGKPLVQKVEVNHPCKYPSSESVPIIVNMTPEAAQFWYQFTTESIGHQVALSLDGVVFQEWKIQSGIGNGCFFIMKKWSSKDELEAFCKQLVRQ